MNKKTTKIMATALAATMGAGMATQLVQAAEMTPVQAVEAMEKNPTAANIDTAYALVQAMEDGKEKDELNARIVKVAGPMHEAAHKAVEAAEASKDLKDVAAARKLVVGLPNIFQQDKWTWSASLDVLTMIPEMKVHDTLKAINDGKEEVKQATINELRPMIDGLGLQGEDNEGLNKHVLDYSANLDKIQADYINEVVAMVEKATTVDEIKAARAKYDDLMTMTNEALKEGLKADLGVKLEAKEAELTAGVKLDNVKVLNLRQLEIKFNKEVKASTVTLDNIYVDITNEETGAISTNSLSSLVATAAQWELVTTDNQTFVLQSKNGELLTSIKRGDNTTGTLNLNEKFEVAARNVVDKGGKFGNTSAVVTLMADTVRPEVSLAKSKVELVANKTNVSLKFSEPVRTNKAVSGVDPYEIYVDGNKLELKASNFEDVVTNATVAKHSVITLKDLELEKGKHTIAVVGARDLNGNLLANNGETFTVEVVDPSSPVTPDEEVLQLVGMTQVADNSFRIDTNLASLTDDQRNAILNNTVVKEGAYDATNKVYKDIEITEAGTKYKVVDRIVGYDEEENPITNKSIVVFLKAARNEASADVEQTLAYRGANAMNKKIVVKAETTNGLKKEYSTTVKFEKDTTAPVIKDASKDVIQNKTSQDTISVSFVDGPFFTDGNGEVALGTGKKAVVKMTDEKGKTYSEDVTPTLGADKKSIDIKVTNAQMLKDGKLVAGATYTVVLEDGIVTDAEETIIADGVYTILDEVHPFVGRTVALEIAKEAEAPADINVPQTSKGMIVTGYEINEKVGALATKIEAAIKGGTSELKSAANEEIFVVFDGKDIDAKTVLNKDNYVLNGKVLPEAATIEFREANIDGVAGKEQFALITLPKETIALTGGYDFTVRNIANTDGNKMLQVDDVIKLKDNTAATITGVNVTASNTVEVTFSENVKTDMVDADATAAEVAKNFVVTINGREYEVISAVKHDKYANKIILQTGENFDLGAKATVGMKLNSNGDMFVTDVEGNRCNPSK